MIFDKLDFVNDKQLFLDFLEYQYGEYLESEREALIDSLNMHLSCPRCKGLMELVSMGYNIEAELEQGEPVLAQLYKCDACGYEETYHNGQAIGGSQ